jgi:hypothetical protein
LKTYVLKAVSSVSLWLLSFEIKRFVKNPVFDEAAILDVQSAIRARLDLVERIVELSRELRQRLRKAEGNK